MKIPGCQCIKQPPVLNEDLLVSLMIQRKINFFVGGEIGTCSDAVLLSFLCSTPVSVCT